MKPKCFIVEIETIECLLCPPNKTKIFAYKQYSFISKRWIYRYREVNSKMFTFLLMLWGIHGAEPIHLTAGLMLLAALSYFSIMLNLF